MTETLVVLFIACVIGALVLWGVISASREKKSQQMLKDTRERLEREEKQKLAELAAKLPPLKEGSLFNATIEPLGSAGVEVHIRLSEAARAVLDKGLWDYSLGDIPNPSYNNELRINESHWKTYEEMKNSGDGFVRSAARKPTSEKPSHTVPVLIRELCAPQGYHRRFDTVGDANTASEQIRAMLPKLKNFIEHNASPVKKQTFDL